MWQSLNVHLRIAPSWFTWYSYNNISLPLSELNLTVKWDPLLSSCLVTWTESGLIDQRLFKAASTTSAEAVTGIIPEGRKDKTHSLMFSQVQWHTVSGCCLLATKAKKKMPCIPDSKCRACQFFFLFFFFAINEWTNKNITSHGGSISQTEEGVSTEMAGTVAAHCDLLNLIDCNTFGQVFKVNDLHGCDKERRGELRKNFTLRHLVENSCSL